MMMPVVRGGTKCDCKIDWLWVRSPLEEVKYLFNFFFHFVALVSRQVFTFIFSFVSSGVEAKRSAEFRYSTRNASRIDGKWRTECLNTRFPLPTLLCVGYSVKLIYLFYFYPWIEAIREPFNVNLWNLNQTQLTICSNWYYKVIRIVSSRPSLSNRTWYIQHYKLNN